MNITVNNFNFENSRHASDIQLNIDSNGSRKSSNNCIKQVIRKRRERGFQNYLRIYKKGEGRYCRDVLFEYHRAVVPICLAVRPVRSQSSLW